MYCAERRARRKKLKQHKIEVKRRNIKEDEYFVCIHFSFFFVPVNLHISFCHCMCLLFLHHLFYLHLTNDDDNRTSNGDVKKKIEKEEEKRMKNEIK